MSPDFLYRPTFFMLSLMLLGYISRRYGLLSEGEEKVLSKFVFYFALPALVIKGLSSVNVDQRLLGVALASSLSMVITSVIMGSLSLTLGLGRDRAILLAAASVTGNTGFLGIPYVKAAIPEAESLAIVSWAATLFTWASVVVPLFEASRSSKGVLRRLAKGPLIWSALLGLSLMASGVRIPDFASFTLDALGETSGPVAIFMLGAFFYGKGRPSLSAGPLLGKILLLPAVSLALSTLMGLDQEGVRVVTLMSAMPEAVVMAVLSEVYNFHREEIYSLILVTTMLSPLYLGAWFLVLS